MIDKTCGLEDIGIHSIRKSRNRGHRVNFSDKKKTQKKVQYNLITGKYKGRGLQIVVILQASQGLET